MKRPLFVLFSMLFLAALVTAQDKSATPATSLPPNDFIKAVVVSYQKNDNAQKKPAILKVKTEQGTELSLRVLATSALHEATGKDLSYEHLVKGLKVAVKVQSKDKEPAGDLIELTLLK